MEPVFPLEAAGIALVKRALCDDTATVDSEHDALEFGVHVRALAELLTADETQTPVTVSVEGEWGSGKTSFLRQLQTYVKNRAYPTVFFNAWRHDKSESLWATFALECVNALRRHYSLPSRLLRDVKLTISRFDFESALPDIVAFVWRFVLFAVVLGASIYLLVNPEHPGNSAIAKNVSAPASQTALLSPGTEKLAARLVGIGGVASALILLLLTLSKVRALVGDPFEIKLRRYVSDPGYKARVTFAETFHIDFARILRDYVGQSKFYAFIDDLDRCEPQQAAELLQSLNILTSGSVKGPVFIIGMDRKIVAAALANKNSAIVSYLSPSSASGSQTTATDDALDYGYAFMDKFIQLPLRVPRARREHLERLLRDDPAKVQKTADSPRARSIIDSAAAILDYNPRRLKQFINVFRLNVHTFVLAGRISDTPISRELLPGMQELTLEKLGLFLSLVLRWPRLVEFLSNNPRLLRELQKLANDEGYTPQEKLHDIERFRGVVACLRVMENSSFPAALWSKEEREKIFSLEELDIADLLATTPLAGRDWTVGMDKVPDFSEVSQVTPTGLQTLVRSRGPWHSEALELVYPLRAGRLVHCRYDPSDGRGWRGLETFGSDAVFEEVAMIQSDYMHGNLEAIARRGDRLEFCYHPSDDISHWNVPYGLDIRVDGRPLLIQSALGENGNFELVIPLTSGGLQHWWRNNTEAKRRWRPEQVFATDLANPRLIAMFEIIEGGQSDLIVFCQTQKTIVSIRRTNYKWGRSVVIGEASIPLGFATAVRHPNIDSYYDFFIPTESGGIDRFIYDEQGKWSKLERIAEGFQVNAVAAVRHKNRCDLIMRSSDSLYYFAQSESGSNWTEPISITQHLEKQTSA